MLLIGRGKGKGTPEGHQLAPFEMYRKHLRQKLGLTFKRSDPPDLQGIEEAVRSNAADVAMVMVSWAEPKAKIISLFQRLREDHPRLKIIFLDYFAPTCSPFFQVIPYVDLYVKRQVLRDRSLYKKPFLGGFIFTDYLVQKMGYEIGDWHFGSFIPDGLERKLVHGWNLGVTPQYRLLLKLNRWLPKRWSRRKYDVNGRIGAPVYNNKREWYQQYREFSCEIVEQMGARRSVTRSERVKRRQYIFELRDSRIVFSPFGWGELCFRDYEAVCCGSLLIKPSMAHLKTSPHIFVDNQMYVPTQWNLSDFPQLCDEYLSNPEAAQRIATNAQDALHDYFENDGFVKDMQRILSELHNRS